MPYSYLTKDQLLTIHKKVLRGQEDESVLDEGMLDLALSRPAAAYGGLEFHRTLQSKAAALMHEILKLHPFVAGNKRTGYLAADTFLRMNGYELQPLDKEAVEVAKKTASCTVGISLLANWMIAIMHRRTH